MDSRRHRKSLNDHNFDLFHPILKNEGTKMIYSSRGIDWWKDLSSIYVRSKIWIFCHFWPKMALLGGQKIKILNFNWLALVCTPFTSYNFTIIKLLLKKWKLCYTLLAHASHICVFDIYLCRTYIVMLYTQFLFIRNSNFFQAASFLIFHDFEPGSFLISFLNSLSQFSDVLA